MAGQKVNRNWLPVTGQHLVANPIVPLRVARTDGHNGALTWRLEMAMEFPTN